MNPTAKDEAAESIKLMNKAREAIVAHAQLNHCRSSTANCPVCGTESALRYSIASNGHVMASCFTPHCVRWIE